MTGQKKNTRQMYDKVNSKPLKSTQILLHAINTTAAYYIAEMHKLH